MVILNKLVNSCKKLVTCNLLYIIYKIQVFASQTCIFLRNYKFASLICNFYRRASLLYLRTMGERERVEE